MHDATAQEIARLREQLEVALGVIKDERAKNLKLQGHIAWLMKQLMGRKSERRLDTNTGDLFAGLDVDQPDAASGESEVAEEAPSAVGATKKPRRKVGGRRKLPEDLPRQTTEIRPPEAECRCGRCDVEKREIGREITERLEYKPGSLIVLREERIKLSCPKCQLGVVCPTLPPRPIDRGLPGPALLAFILTSKYGEHSTLYRLESILERHGVDISRSTMCGWIAAAVSLLAPIVKEMRRQLLASGYVKSDDTSVRLLGAREEGGSSSSYIWLYRGSRGLTLYDFRRGRSRDGPERFLEGFEGHLQVDGYAAYDQLFRSGRMVRVGCWAHARRYFVKAEDTAIDLATAMIGMIRVLYRIEDQARDLPPAERQALRQRESVPMLRMIKEWLDAKSREVLPKSPIGEAITYTLGQWEALQVYASDGRLDIDNNTTENAVRPVALGRKNWLFFAGEAGGQRAAVLFSLVTSCKELGVDPYAYLADVLDKVSVVPVSRIHELTPLGWKQAREVNAVGAALAVTA